MDYKKYSNYSIEDFADDPDFKNWVRMPNERLQTYWETILLEDENLKSKITQARQLVEKVDLAFQKELPDVTPDPKFAKLLTNIVQQDQSAKKRALTKPIVQRRWAIAATIAVLLSVGLWFFVPQQDVSAKNWVVHTTEFEEWKAVNLPDGSIVHLNAHSELRLKSNWEEGQNRQVWLKGEAFFEVTKKVATKAKFQVITDALQVEVLGTMFNVKTNGDNTKVFLEEGKIQLKSDTERLSLKPNDFIDYTKGEKLLEVTQKTSKQADISWKDGTLILTQSTVAEILDRLEEIYGYSFDVEQKDILTQRKTLAVPMDKLEVILPILERTLQVDIEKDGRTLRLKAL